MGLSLISLYVSLFFLIQNPLLAREAFPTFSLFYYTTYPYFFLFLFYQLLSITLYPCPYFFCWLTPSMLIALSLLAPGSFYQLQTAFCSFRRVSFLPVSRCFPSVFWSPLVGTCPGFNDILSFQAIAKCDIWHGGISVLLLPFGVSFSYFIIPPKRGDPPRPFFSTPLCCPTCSCLPPTLLRAKGFSFLEPIVLLPPLSYHPRHISISRICLLAFYLSQPLLPHRSVRWCAFLGLPTRPPHDCSFTTIPSALY